ncbi:Crp/Fnr family transcriptional regulator [Altericista sp. CCNU0014]|uniref:Crp/Fnr family transcriptional regulator n=1 Tax=Altericista sp. CCNU0014 TaxID=3082949 RepID=UPI00384F66D7
MNPTPQRAVDGQALPLGSQEICTQGFQVSPHSLGSITPFTCQTFAKGESIPPLEDKLWLIEKGIARTFTFTESGSTTGLGYWKKGDVVGLPLANLAVYQIECATPVEARILSRNEWPQYLEAIFYNAQQKAQLMNVLSHKQVYQRLVCLLEWLGHRFGRQVPEGLLIDIPLPHYAIGEMVGATRETVTHYLGEFKKQGTLIQRRCRIVLLQDFNEVSLQSIAPQLLNRQQSARKAV